MKRLERWFFPTGELLNFIVILILSGAIAFLLIGRQIFQANWGMIDDHEIFNFLGPRLHLPAAEIWSTLLSKTEVGSLQGRFRPTYYVFKLIETSLWGTNVHLWYLARTIGFATFLGSIWWLMRRFVGFWLGGVLTAGVSLVPLWAGVWSRLGPSEAYGAACIGIMLYAAYFLLFCEGPRSRNVSAVVLTLATIALVGLKETFIPLAGGALVILILAGFERKLSSSVVVILMLAVLAALTGLIVVIARQVQVSGADYYANAVGFWPVLKFAGKGGLFAIRRTWWICLLPVLLFGILNKKLRLPLVNWAIPFGIAIGAYGFLVMTYAGQCAFYRSDFPLNTRYDFPAMLLVPLSFCVMACYVGCMVRPLISERMTNYGGFGAAALLVLYFVSGVAHSDNGKALAAAVQTNIDATNAFYSELQLALRVAEKFPESPIILEAYGPGAYEPVFSLAIYLPALGAGNRISVRLHPDQKSYGKLYDGLQQGLADLEKASTGAFTPLRDNLAHHAQGCISIGINGSPDAACSGFRVNTL
jgi:hypothetical protein